MTVMVTVVACGHQTLRRVDIEGMGQALLDPQEHVGHWKTHPWNYCSTLLVGTSLGSLKTLRKRQCLFMH